jgi:hypothetical protein
LDIICVRPVRSAFKDELAIVIDDHGEAVTIKAVVLEANEAVVFEANEAVVFGVRTHCRLVQRCGRETEGSSCTGFRR